MRLHLLVFTAMLMGSHGFASDDEADINEYTKAVESTQKDLVNASQRANMADTKESKMVVDHAKNLTGNAADEDRLYEISSQVLGEVKGNNEAALSNTINKAQQNPEAFYNSLSPEAQKKIRELAGSIEERQKQKP